MIYILSTGVGNFQSIKNILTKIGYLSKIVNKDDEIIDPSLLIIPGVGNFKNTMIFLKENYDQKKINFLVKEKKIPVLGICVGMQILGTHSEEGNYEGLGWMNFRVKRFTKAEVPKIPHMGWNNVIPLKSKEYFLNEKKSRFYFVHSFYCDVEEKKSILAKTVYKNKIFISAVQYENVTGVQFHPEKSHKYGEYFLRNYISSINI